jgi:hypothetical protein
MKENLPYADGRRTQPTWSYAPNPFLPIVLRETLLSEEHPARPVPRLGALLAQRALAFHDSSGNESWTDRAFFEFDTTGRPDPSAVDMAQAEIDFALYSGASLGMSQVEVKEMTQPPSSHTGISGCMRAAQQRTDQAPHDLPSAIAASGCPPGDPPGRTPSPPAAQGMATSTPCGRPLGSRSPGMEPAPPFANVGAERRSQACEKSSTGTA